MEDLDWFVYRDGSAVSPAFASDDQAHMWLQRHQGMSNDWAIRHEGYAIVAQPRIAHVDYPHEPGSHEACPACEIRCHCKAGETECVFEGEHDVV